MAVAPGAEADDAGFEGTFISNCRVKALHALGGGAATDGQVHLCSCLALLTACLVLKDAVVHGGQ